MVATDLVCARNARTDFIPLAEKTSVYVAETMRTLMERLGPHHRPHAVSSTDELINQSVSQFRRGDREYNFYLRNDA